MSYCCGSNGNPFVQTLFMGASVVGFSAQADWGGGGGLQVELVNDTCTTNSKVYVDGLGNILTTTQADNFNPPTVGSPAYFYYGGFTHCGILQSWQCNDSADGHKHYRVNIVSPRDIVDGVQLILQHYDGGNFGVPNLVNINGFLQNLCSTCLESNYFSLLYPPMGFSNGMTYIPAPGFCKVSEAGWRTYLIRTALTSIINSNITIYGGYIKFRDHSYLLDLSELPWLDYEIRFNEENMSLGEFVSKICELAGVEHFWEVIPYASGNGGCAQSGHLGTGPHTLKVRCGTNPIQAIEQSAEDVDSAICSNIDDRLNQGKISKAITNSSCVNRYSTGLELRMDKTTAFMTGEFRKDVWQMAYFGTGDGYSDTIWPFWGFNYAGNVIIGQGYAYNNFDVDEYDNNGDLEEKKTHTFTIPITHLGIGINTWTVSVPELRCVLISEDAWRTWLYNIEQDKYNALFNPGIDIKLKVDENIFLNNLMSKVRDGVAAANPDATKLHFNDIFNIDIRTIKHGLDTNEEYYRRCGLLYQHLRKLATEYYGRRFMVKLPFLCASYNPDSPYSIATSWNPCDAGWTEMPVLGLAQTSPILEFFRTDDARVKCFARFISSAIQIELEDGTKQWKTPQIRMEKMNKDNFWPVSAWEVYVGGVVERIVWVSPTDPRAVIDIGAAVEIDNPDGILPEWLLIYTLINKANKDLGKNIVEGQNFRNMVRVPGGDKLAIGSGNMLLLPVSAAVPLQSDKLVYGPWFCTQSGSQFDFTTGGIFWNGYTNGQTSYERDSSYAPWNFGSMNIMNIIAYKKVSSMLGDKYVQERGDITFPGAPTTNLGSLIDSGGPMISQIDVSFERGSSAVLTTLRMKTYTPDYGKLWKARIDALRRANGIGMKANRMFAKYANGVYKDRINVIVDNYNFWMSRRRHQPMSSHEFLAGRVEEDSENTEHARTTVVSSELTKEILSIHPDDDRFYRRNALMSNIGMFRPFSTLPESEREFYDDAKLMSKFGEPVSNSKDGYIPGGWPTGQGEYLTNNVDFYSKEQIPPIFCKEHHLPIVVETLSPFLADGTSAKAGLYMNENGPSNKGHDIEYIVRDGTYPTHLSVRHPQDNYSENHWYRAIALRGPLVIAGWGFDTNNKPVPNASEDYPENPKMQFKDDWLRRPQDWKCGPVDLRWDDDRKVWTTPVPHKIIRAILMENVGATGYAPALLIDDQTKYDLNGNEVETETFCGETGYKINIKNEHMRPIPKGWKITGYYDTTNSKYYILSHDEYPLLEATLDESLERNSTAYATISDSGVAGTGNIDPGLAFSGLKIELSNPLNRRVHKGKKVIAWINDILVDETGIIGGPTYEDGCEPNYPKITGLKGVVTEAEEQFIGLYTWIDKDADYPLPIHNESGHIHIPFEHEYGYYIQPDISGFSYDETNDAWECLIEGWYKLSWNSMYGPKLSGVLAEWDAVYATGYTSGYPGFQWEYNTNMAVSGSDYSWYTWKITRNSQFHNPGIIYGGKFQISDETFYHLHSGDKVRFTADGSFTMDISVYSFELIIEKLTHQEAESWW